MDYSDIQDKMVGEGKVRKLTLEEFLAEIAAEEKKGREEIEQYGDGIINDEDDDED